LGHFYKKNFARFLLRNWLFKEKIMRYTMCPETFYSDNFTWEESILHPQFLTKLAGKLLSSNGQGIHEISEALEEVFQALDLGTTEFEAGNLLNSSIRQFEIREAGKSGCGNRISELWLKTPHLEMRLAHRFMGDRCNPPAGKDACGWSF
jgi:hypothetical protein